MSPEHTALFSTLRGVMSGVLLCAFIGLWIWTYGKRRRAPLEAASRLPLEEDPMEGSQP